MKIYATMQSERGKVVHKSGNEFLEIDIMAEEGEFLGSIRFSITKDGVGDLYNAKIDFAEYVYVNGHHWLNAEVRDRNYTKGKINVLPPCGHRHCDIDNVCEEEFSNASLGKEFLASKHADKISKEDKEFYAHHWEARDKKQKTVKFFPCTHTVAGSSCEICGNCIYCDCVHGHN